MNELSLKEEVARLLGAIEASELEINDLGTPRPVETTEVNELVDMGPRIVPFLLTLLGSASSKRDAYIALVLGRLGDASALEALRDLKTEYEAKESTSGWELSVIAQAEAAIKLLEAMLPEP